MNTSNKNSITVISNSPEETFALGTCIGKALTHSCTLALYGNLGAGKTIFTKGVANGLGINADLITSPTFVLINEYAGRLPLYHVDAYRLNSSDDLIQLGSDEFLNSDSNVVVIEWADRVEAALEEDYCKISFIIEHNNVRKIIFGWVGNVDVTFLNALEECRNFQSSQ